MVRNCTHSESLVLIRISFCISGTKNVAKQMRKIACGTQRLKESLGFQSCQTNVSYSIVSLRFVVILYIIIMDIQIRQNYKGPLVLLYEKLFSICHKA